MKKLSLILALALSLASSAFAEKNHKGKKWCNENPDKCVKNNECSRLEVKENGEILRDGKEVKDITMLSGLVGCSGKIKGEKEYKAKQEQIEKERYNKLDTVTKK